MIRALVREVLRDAAREAFMTAVVESVRAAVEVVREGATERVKLAARRDHEDRHCTCCRCRGEQGGAGR